MLFINYTHSKVAQYVPKNALFLKYALLIICELFMPLDPQFPLNFANGSALPRCNFPYPLSPTEIFGTYRDTKQRFWLRTQDRLYLSPSKESTESTSSSIAGGLEFEVSKTLKATNALIRT